MDASRIEERLVAWMRANGHTVLRFGMGLVFLWFGAPKLVPGLSPAEDLVAATVPLNPDWFVPALGLTEMLIGLCLMVRRWNRIGLVLLAGHMLGAALPLVTLPDVAWQSFPVATLEGQYILKNVVLISAAIVIGGTTEIERRCLPALPPTPEPPSFVTERRFHSKLSRQAETCG